jgi:sugar-specific transcriptional regulator TrmB
LSQQKIINTLQNLGLSSLDAQVYLFLGKKGPKKVKELVQALKIPKQQLYVILKDLQSKGIINTTLERPARFSVEPFEKVLDLFVKAKMEEVQQIQGKKSEILTDWQSIKIEDRDNPTSFKVLEGNNYIYPKLEQMIEEAKTQLSIVVTLPELIRINQNEILDEIFSKISKSKIKLRMLTEITSKNAKAISEIFRKRLDNLEIRVPDLGLKLPSSMVIRDEDEVAFIIDSTENGGDKQHNICLWTNCKALVLSFRSVFNETWYNSIESQKKLSEINTGKPSPKTFVIKDANEAQKKYEEKKNAAQKSIYMITSSNGLIKCWNDKNLTDSLIQKRIQAKIMAPITNENLQATKQLMNICQVKHVPEGYVETTIIDHQYLFQFNTQIPRNETLQEKPNLENTIYTDDAEYIEKTENMLDNIWENAQPPSLSTIGTIVQPSTPTVKPIRSDIFDGYRTEFKKMVGVSYKKEPQQGKLDERGVLKKIAEAKRIPAKNPEIDTVRTYGRMGTVIIYPPKKLNLPKLLFQICFANKNSSFGVSSSLTVSIQTNIPDQQSYLQTVFITDNPKGFNFRKAMQKNRHTAEAVYLLNKNELVVHSTSNGLFAGWTIPIPLLFEKYILPPGSITFEGTGEIRTYSSELKGLLNRSLIYEFNCLEAFVSFMLPSSRYYSPATDGLLYRECIITSYPSTFFKEKRSAEQRNVSY